MSAPRPFEESLLRVARGTLDEAARNYTDPNSAALSVLEAAASRLGGFSYEGFRSRFAIADVVPPADALEVADRILRELARTPIHTSLALSALARPILNPSEQRTTGAYYTDFRLAEHVASLVAPHVRDGARVIDPACGTGILLVAVTLRACGPDRYRLANWLAHSVYAADLSEHALRGARLALASLTDDLDVIEQMVSRWRCGDSLAAGIDDTFSNFDIVVGNPPWEKLKLTRHEFVRAKGGTRHYGAEYHASGVDQSLYVRQRDQVASYADALAERYSRLGGGEPDLYKAFLELFANLARPGGCVSVLVPAGFIRSQGTESLRRWVFDTAAELSITVLENRARFFSIDTRFKFLSLHFVKTDRIVSGRGSTKSSNPRSELRLWHARGTDAGVEITGTARIGRKTLATIRNDLTVPEVRSDREWRLFRAISERAKRRADHSSAWAHEIVREVDMTRDRKWFRNSPTTSALPLVEGRMIHQHRFGAKMYRSGTGRAARWETTPLFAPELGPQFWVPREHLSNAASQRVDRVRAGFCDITGQTNERSMLAALVPAGVVCGNKVPTVTFPDDPSEERLFLWLAIVNSLPFDWMLRRVVTTTVNYFVLLSVPLPQIDRDSLPGRRLSAAARDLHTLHWHRGGALDPWRFAELRAAIDLDVLSAYGCGYADLITMLDDFPLLDRGQTPLQGEARSTITRDYLLATAARRFKTPHGEAAERVRAARALGAMPFIPSEFIGADDKVDEVANA